MLSEEQKKLVEENHYLIDWFAGINRLSLDEYYGILAIALCNAAICYDPEKAQFNTYATHSMRNAVNAHHRHHNTKARRTEKMTISYDALVLDADPSDRKITLLDALFDSSESTEDKAVMNVALSEMLPLLSKREQEVLLLSLKDFSQRQIAEKIGVSQPQVSRIVKKIKQKIIM